MGADVDRHFLIEPFEKNEQPVSRESAEMPVHKVGHFGLLGTEKRSNFPLIEFFFD